MPACTHIHNLPQERPQDMSTSKHSNSRISQLLHCSQLPWGATIRRRRHTWTAHVSCAWLPVAAAPSPSEHEQLPAGCVT